MSNQEILTKAIEKAVENGWNNKLRRYSGIEAEWQIDGDVPGNPDLEALIFNHDFAKALWKDPDGEDEPHEVNRNEVTSTPKYYWQYHLQQMVIAEDPIKYLGENL